MTERTFAARPWFAHLGVAKHAYCSFESNPAWGLSQIKATLCAAKAECSVVTAMSQCTIIRVIDPFIHSAKWAALLKNELERLMLLAIVECGTYVTTIEDDYSRPLGAQSLKSIDGTTAVLEHHIANNVISARFKIYAIRTDNSGVQLGPKPGDK